jgi:hypothetical protein
VDRPKNVISCTGKLIWASKYHSHNSVWGRQFEDDLRDNLAKIIATPSSFEFLADREMVVIEPLRVAGIAISEPYALALMTYEPGGI